MASWERTREELEYIDRMCQQELDANRHVIPKGRIEEGIQHYLDHDEYETAFEYLYLEIMEREQDGTRCTIGKDKALEIALMLEIDNQAEAMIDYHFWSKFSKWIETQQ